MSPLAQSLRRLALLAAASIVLALPATASADTPLRGAQVHSLWADTPTRDADRELDMLADAGSSAIRLDINWSSLETEGKGQYDQSYLAKADHVIQKAASRNLKVVAVLWGTPCWASSAPDSVKQGCSGAYWDRGTDRYAPRNISDFGDISSFVASRWGAKLAALEVWNEPNLEDQYALRAANPAATDAALLKAAYPRIKAAAPNLPVLAGALSGSDGSFLETLYANGIKGNFDGISIHPYNEWRDPNDAWQDQYKRWSFLRGVPWIHQVMQAHGDGAKGVWLTEFGFSSCGQGDRWCVNEAQQARYIQESFKIIKNWDYVKAALVYNLRNKGSDPNGREDQFGMLRRDFSPKPAWNAYKAAMADTSAPVAPQVTVGSSLTVAPTGSVIVPVTCTTGATCAGTISVVTSPARGAKRAVKLRSKRLRIARGKTVRLRVAIPRAARAKLRRAKRVRAKVTVSASGRSSRRLAGAASVQTLRTVRATRMLRTARLAVR